MWYHGSSACLGSPARVSRDQCSRSVPLGHLGLLPVLSDPLWKGDQRGAIGTSASSCMACLHAKHASVWLGLVHLTPLHALNVCAKLAT